MPLMSITDVMQRLDTGQVDPVYLFFGDESYLLQDYTASCIERILTAATRDFNLDVLEANPAGLTQALSIAQTLPMMASYRVVVLHGVQQLRKEEMRQLTDYVAQPSASTALICDSTDSDFKKLPIVFQQRVPAVACKRLDGAPLRAWVVNLVKRNGYTMAAEAVREFLEEQQNDLWVIKAEVEKLCTYAGETKQIGLSEVQAVCQASFLHSIFKLSDAIAARELGQALRLIEALLQQGEPPLVIFSMLVRHLRLLWSIHHLARQRQSVSEIAKALHLPQAVCRTLMAQGRAMSAERLSQLYTAALDADMTFKTTSRPVRDILEGLILEICTDLTTSTLPKH